MNTDRFHHAIIILSDGSIISKIKGLLCAGNSY
jgi:hypothetical protein